MKFPKIRQRLIALIADDLGGADASTEIVSLGLSDLQPVRLFFVDEM